MSDLHAALLRANREREHGGGERYFKVTLSERQLQTSICALETLSAGDPEAEAENESTLAALDDAEEVK